MSTAPHPNPRAALPDPLPGTRSMLATPSGEIACYRDGPASGRPLLLVHSINAAASAYEVRPVYLGFRTERPVWALDLPGYGHSTRPRRRYESATMAAAVVAMARHVHERHGMAAHLLGVSLGAEYAARAAVEAPGCVHSLALVSPTGLSRRWPLDAAPGSTLGRPWLYRTLTRPWLGPRLFALLTVRPSIRYFLRRTWGSRNIDDGLAEYDWLTSHQPGAEHAPLCFLSGYLFGADALALYRRITQPVWCCHGVRGDFTDYRRKALFERDPRWSFRVFDSGALPHFEHTADFLDQYRRFLERADKPG